MNLFDKIGLFFMLAAIYAQVIAGALYWPAVAVLFAGLLIMYWADYLDNAWWRWRERRAYRRNAPDLFGGQWEDGEKVEAE